MSVLLNLRKRQDDHRNDSSSGAPTLTLPPGRQSSQPRGGSRQCKPGCIAASVLGVFGFLLIMTVVGVWLLGRRRKFALFPPTLWNDGGISPRRNRTTAKEDVVLPDLEPEWAGLPVDDATILRRFKEIDDRISSHVFDFYILDEEVVEGEELRAVPHDKRRSVVHHLSHFEYLVALEDARVYALRAALGGIILEAFDKGAFFTDRYTEHNIEGGKLTSNRADNSPAGYHEARERTILRLAQVVHDLLSPFVSTKTSSDLCLQSLESVVRSVAQFAEIIERQPATFELVWTAKGFTERKKVPFREEEMEVAVTIAGDRKRDPKVRGVVFPGLEKTVDLETLLLVRIQVLMY